jgi:hypothetical protein
VQQQKSAAKDMKVLPDIEDVISDAKRKSNNIEMKKRKVTSKRNKVAVMSARSSDAKEEKENTSKGLVADSDSTIIQVAEKRTENKNGYSNASFNHQQMSTISKRIALTILTVMTFHNGFYH